MINGLVTKKLELFLLQAGGDESLDPETRQLALEAYEELTTERKISEMNADIERLRKEEIKRQLKFWLKLYGFGVLGIGALVLIGKLGSNDEDESEEIEEE